MTLENFSAKYGKPQTRTLAQLLNCSEETARKILVGERDLTSIQQGSLELYDRLAELANYAETELSKAPLGYLQYLSWRDRQR